MHYYGISEPNEGILRVLACQEALPPEQFEALRVKLGKTYLGFEEIEIESFSNASDLHGFVDGYVNGKHT